jgi:hypothetical protein
MLRLNFFLFSGCLHAHISYLDDSCDVCLVLLTVNPEHFQILSDFKQTIGEVRICFLFVRKSCIFKILEIKKTKFNHPNQNRFRKRSSFI